MSDDLFADAETDLGHAKKIVDTNFGDDDDSWESLMDEKPKVIEPEKKVVKKEKKEEPKKIEPKKPEPKKTVKPKEGMMKELEKDMSEMSVTEELFSDSPVIRIDMMKPKTQKDFEQFGEIVSNKLLEFENEKKFYPALLKDILTRTTENMKSVEIKELGMFLSALSSKRAEQEKNKNKPKAKTSVVVGKEIDPFGLDSVTRSEAGTYNNDDDFM